MAVLLCVCSDLVVVLVDEDAHFGQQLNLLLVQVVCGYLRHSDRRLQVSGLTVAHRRGFRQITEDSLVWIHIEMEAVHF